MLSIIKQMERNGEWIQIRHEVPEILVQLRGEDRSRALIALAVSYERTATTPAEYRLALHHAEQAVTSASAGGFNHTWALHLVAVYATDLGLHKRAEHAALAFLEAVPGHDQAERVAPIVRYNLGRVRASQGLYEEAVALFEQVALEPDGVFAEKARLWKAWTLALAGCPTEAFAALPVSIAHISKGHLSAATAVVMATAGDWSGAQLHAKAALRTRSEWAVYDAIQIAELCLILKRAAEESGHFASAAVWFIHSAARVALWNPELINHLLPTLRREGGVWTDAASTRCGAAGHARTGLLGTVG